MKLSELQPLTKLTPFEIENYRMIRWKCRTDLGYLCREILHYPDVSDVIHAPILDILQKFPVPTREQFFEHDKVVNGKWEYKPLQRMTSLPGGRRVLILDPRGWLKTTINAQAHTIQWILNYPDVAIMIFQSNLDKAEMILGEIKKHFQYNDDFRLVFPEHCPFRSIGDFGTKGRFTTMARSRSNTRKEETLMASSIDAGSSGIHVDVMKFSDIVEPSNVGTPEQMQSVTSGFYMSQNLLVGPNYWIDVEGTRYDFADTYGEIIKLERDLPLDKRMWKIHARGCYKKITKDGLPQKFTPDELFLPDFKNDKDELVPHWDDAERGFTYKHFESKRAEDPYIFSSQQLNCPAGGVGGRAIFPVEEKKYPALITRKNFTENVRVAHYIATVDTAETANDRSNYTCITIGAFASDGRIYINEVIHGKFLPHEIVALICNLPKADRNKEDNRYNYGAKLRAINIEETAFVRGLMVSLSNYQQTTGNFLPLNMIKRDNRVAKLERIQNSLQPYYMSKHIVFLDDLKAMDKILEELQQFPKSQTDDILDTLADLFQDKTWFGREVAKPTYTQLKSDMMNKWLGLESPFGASSGVVDSEQVKPLDPYYRSTGGL